MSTDGILKNAYCSLLLFVGMIRSVLWFLDYILVCMYICAALEVVYLTPIELMSQISNILNFMIR